MPTTIHDRQQLTTSFCKEGLIENYEKFSLPIYDKIVDECRLFCENEHDFCLKNMTIYPNKEIEYAYNNVDIENPIYTIIIFEDSEKEDCEGGILMISDRKVFLR